MACGARWSTGSGGCGEYHVDPRLPEAWTSLTYRVTLHGARVRVQVEREQVTLTLETGEMARLVVRGKEVQVTPDEPVVVPLDGQGPRLPGGPPVWGRDGVRRADGTVITASVPRPAETPHPSE